MPTLLEVQHAMRCSLLHHGDGAAAAFILSDGLAPEARLDIYRNTASAALTLALRLAYPAVYRLVGGEFFEGVARIFIEEKPPRSAYLDEYGAAFPDFLASFPSAASLPYLVGVARLEWAVNGALHAPDVEVFDLSDLSAVGPADYGRIVFAAHPSMGLVNADYPADAVWRAVLAPGRCRHRGNRAGIRPRLAARATVRDRRRCQAHQRKGMAICGATLCRSTIAGGTRRNAGL